MRYQQNVLLCRFFFSIFVSLWRCRLAWRRAGLLWRRRRGRPGEARTSHWRQIVGRSRLNAARERPQAAAYQTQALFLCALSFFGPSAIIVQLFSNFYPIPLTNASRCHEYSQRLSRLLPEQGVLVSFLEQQRFEGDMALLALRDWQKAISKSQRSFT